MDPSTRARSRAPKACSRCHKRKIKCDAAQIGVPCTRCRMDHVDDCALIVSKRGMYERKNFRKRTASQQSEEDNRCHGTTSSVVGNNQSVQSQYSTHNDESDLLASQIDKDLFPPQSTHIDTGSSSTHVVPNLMAIANNAPMTAHIGPSTSNTTAEKSINSKTISLTKMFEEFLAQQNGSTLEEYGIVLPGEPSPLTFALGEFQRGISSRLHSAENCVNERSSQVEQNVHPSHLDSTDIIYLETKGVFHYIDDTLGRAFMETYQERFHPLYSIVKKDQLRLAYEERKLPWLLYHSVCFIGATFCDDSLIYQSRFHSRVEARAHFYEKAKMLFMLGYEKDKMTLLQAVIMLSFCGPQLKNYWNPCTWTGFGVTIAVSLGIHRASVTRNTTRENKSLLRRIWWTLSTRDAYLSTLLGRSFRLNMSLCDTESLSTADFDNKIDCSHQETECSCEHAMLYQIQMAKLSLILRDILYHRIGPIHPPLSVDDLEIRLKKWQSDLPTAINWAQQNPRGSPIFAVILKILYHYHSMLLHMTRPDQVSSSTHSESNDFSQSPLTASSASIIASTAVTLMTKSVIFAVPHEIFSAFFLAGIILYRQTQLPDVATAEMGRALLDNCQIVLNNARESWDPENWAIRIFDFLLSGPSMSDNTLDNRDVPSTQLPTPTITVADDSYPSMADAGQNSFATFDWSTGLDSSHGGEYQDFMLLSNCFLTTEEWQNLRL